MANGYKKESLSSQTKKHFVVIRKNRTFPINVITDFLNDNYSEWALIVHEKDIDPQTGLVIPTHYHYVGNYIKVKTPLKTTLNELSKALKSDNNDGLEIDKYVHLESCLQYLIHKNNPEKTQHSIDEIMLGGWSKEDLATFITADSTGINFDRVLAVCMTYKSIIDVIRELGFENYAHYRSVIRDIFDEIRVNGYTPHQK